MAKSTCKTVTSCRLIRSADKCEFLEGDMPDNSESLFAITERGSNSHLDEFSIKPLHGPEKVWLIVKDLDEERIRLVEGDVLKLGRALFRVKQLSPDGETRPMFASQVPATPVDIYDPGLGQILACRICLSDIQSEENPLISPCKCAGTMKFIHLECLQNWLKSRLNLKQNGSALSYFWRTLDCELCKEDFPTCIQIREKSRDLVEVHKPNCPFIVLEDIKRDQASRENSSRGLHVVSMSDDSGFKLGRGHDCDIRISDISVSRTHAEICLRTGGFYLQDKDSKFGTLVQVKRPLHLVPGSPLSLQINRTVVVVKVKQPWGLLQCCRCLQKSPQLVTSSIGKSLDERESAAEDGPGAVRESEAVRGAEERLIALNIHHD